MYDVIVIGGGPAGYEAALVASQYGASVSLIDSDGIGGACVLFDCVPSKTFIASTGVRTDMRRAGDLGIELEGATVALPQVHSRVKSLARAQSSDIRTKLEAAGVKLYSGRGELIDSQPGMAAHKVRANLHTGEEKVFDADVVLIATGASPRILPGAEPDGERILTWRQLYDLDTLPEELVVVGSGVTGAEFVSAYPEVGVHVPLVSSRDRVLPHEDEDAALVLEDVLAERGVTLVKHARADAVERTENGVRVLLADDEQLVRSGFRLLLDTEDDITVVGEATTGTDAVAKAYALRPDVVLMDIRMPNLDGIEATREITTAGLGNVRILILTTYDTDAYVFEGLQAGASGFLLKDAGPAELLHAIRVIAAGDALLAPRITRRLIGRFATRQAADRAGEDRLSVLTEREREVLALVGEGLSNQEIGAALFLSPATARTHVSHAMAKLGARDRAQLVVIAYRSGLVTP